MHVLPNPPTAKGSAAMFTGDVFIDVIHPADPPSRMRVNAVHFTPGARTAWHAHARGQTLYVLEGSGFVQSRGERPVAIGPGQVVTTPAGEWHWHGAAPHHLMTHLAMWEAPESGPESEWGDQVTDDEYPSV